MGEQPLFLAIDHPAIACFDAAAQIRWYCTILGMQVIAQNDQNPPTALVGYGTETTIELMPARDPGASPEQGLRFQPGLRHLALRVNNFDQAYDRLRQQGVQFMTEVGNAVGGGRIASFRDPEGNELQIVER